MYEFNYHRPASLDEAKQILAANAEAKIIAGGMTLLPTMKLRLAQPSDLVDLSAIDGLDAISDAGSAIDIGAMATHADVARSEVVRTAIPALADLADGCSEQHNCRTLVEQRHGFPHGQHRPSQVSREDVVEAVGIVSGDRIGTGRVPGADGDAVQRNTRLHQLGEGRLDGGFVEQVDRDIRWA